MKRSWNAGSPFQLRQKLDGAKALKTLERVKGIEPSYSAWKAGYLQARSARSNFDEAAQPLIAVGQSWNGKVRRIITAVTPTMSRAASPHDVALAFARISPESTPCRAFLTGEA